jgi:hypothetical protein
MQPAHSRRTIRRMLARLACCDRLGQMGCGPSTQRRNCFGTTGLATDGTRLRAQSEQVPTGRTGQPTVACANTEASNHGVLNLPLTRSGQVLRQVLD